MSDLGFADLELGDHITWPRDLAGRHVELHADVRMYNGEPSVVFRDYPDEEGEPVKTFMAHARRYDRPYRVDR